MLLLEVYYLLRSADQLNHADDLKVKKAKVTFFDRNTGKLKIVRTWLTYQNYGDSFSKNLKDRKYIEIMKVSYPTI